MVKNIDVGFENARLATDRFKKSDNVKMVIRKKLPSRNRRMQDSDHVVMDPSHAARMHVLVWR